MTNACLDGGEHRWRTSDIVLTQVNCCICHKVVEVERFFDDEGYLRVRIKGISDTEASPPSPV